MRLSLTGYVLIALAASLLANAYLGWQWAGAKAECRADMERAAFIAITDERARAAKAATQAGEIARDTKADTREGVTEGQGNSNAREQNIRAAVVHGDCRMPVGLPRLTQAVSEANAAGGD